MNRPLLILGGTTASGKSKTAFSFAKSQIAKGFLVELIYADSIAVYRGFDIGSAKPSVEEQKEVPHHLIDVCEASTNFTAAMFESAARKTITEIWQRNALPIVVGGTGFYIKALLQGMTDQPESSNRAIRVHLEKRLETEGVAQLYQEMIALDPDLKAKIHINDHYRVVRALEAMKHTGKKWSALNQEALARPPRYPNSFFGYLDLDRDRLRKRVQKRTEQMLKEGLVEETRNLIAAYSVQAKPLQSIGYRECLLYLKAMTITGEKPVETEAELLERIVKNTMRLAKNQRTWFRSQHRAHALQGSEIENQKRLQQETEKL